MDTTAMLSVSMPPTRLRRFVKLLVGLGLTGLSDPAASAEAEVPKVAALGTYVRGPASFVPGTPAALRIAAHWSTSPTASGELAGVERVERRQREAVFYFTTIEPDTFIQLPIWFKPRFPMSAQIPPARIYEYYRSDYGASAAARTLTVRRASDASTNAASSP
jgi:hypothetical protein